ANISNKWGRGGGVSTQCSGLRPYTGLANRRLQPLAHLSGAADMPHHQSLGKQGGSEARENRFDCNKTRSRHHAKRLRPDPHPAPIALVTMPAAEAHVGNADTLRQLGASEGSRGLRARPCAQPVSARRLLQSRGPAAGARPQRGAIASYDQATALEPNFAEVWLNRGRALRALGRSGPKSNLSAVITQHLLAAGPEAARGLRPGDRAQFRTGRAVRCCVPVSIMGGNFDKARASVERAPALEPERAEANALRDAIAAEHRSRQAAPPGQRIGAPARARRINWRASSRARRVARRRFRRASSRP